MSRASALLQPAADRRSHRHGAVRDRQSTEASLRGDPELDRLRAAEAAAHEEHRALGSSAKLAELEAASMQTRIRELDRRLYGGNVRNPAELIEMQRELEAMRAKLSTPRTMRWAHGGGRRVAGSTCRTRRRPLAARECAAQRCMEPLRARLATLTAERDVLNAERDALRADTDPGDLSLYARIAAHRRPAVTGLAGEFCAGCHMPVSNEERRAVRTGTGLTQCANCDRILAP